MINGKRIMGLLSLLLILSIQTQGQGFLKTNGKAIVNSNTGDTIILRGMGLGGWMLQEGYMLQTASFASAQHQIREKIEQLIGEADTDLFYERWLANHVRKIDIDSLKAWGFNSVRLPMHYNLFTLPIEQEPVLGQHTWLTKGFELTDSLISWCKQNEMYVILDLHAAPGGQGQDEGISDYDASKPSLWQSKDNRDKTVALWKKLAERYVDEPWVGGYDLLNEPNWNLPGNSLLKSLYREITDSIRTVDANHIIFIEGNWFANDFTGLTPPWDDNMVYSPHKYWSINDQASIQWVLDMREFHNVPLYLGESGENSNVWFRDAVRLFEDHQIGWAWWPMKKIESIAGPLSVIKTPAYQGLLDYWSGTGTAPSAASAKATLLQITENLKIENCIYQKDVIDALFRQVYSDETIPFRSQAIPGVVYATDYDMGRVGEAYFDSETANYQVSTGTFTSWNTGWAYRNDGVDIESSQNTVNSNGYNVGWVDEGEWMQYTVEVAESGVYDVHVRVATSGFDGRLHFSAGGSDVSRLGYVPNTGGFQSWQTMIIPNVILTPDDTQIRFHADGGGFNVSSFEFIKQSETTVLEPDFVAGITLDKHNVQLDINKPLTGPLPTSPADFQLFVNGSPIPITASTLSNNNPRGIILSTSHTFRSTEVIKASYTGNQIQAQDGTTLKTFSLKDVKNTIETTHPVPGKIEAEDFFFQQGIQLENTTDAGGGQNIGYLDVGDYLDYNIDVANTGIYNVDYRTAAESQTGAVELYLVDDNGNTTLLHAANFPPTGGWQSWATTSQMITLPAGIQHLRMVITQAQFNVNWMDFSLLTSTEEPISVSQLKIYPNPSNGLFRIEGELKAPQDVSLELYNVLGQRVLSRRVARVVNLREELDIRDLPSGQYWLQMELENGELYTERVVKF